MIDLTKYHAIWNESWRYFRHYAEKIPLTDDEWMKAIDISGIFTDRHPEHENLARKIIIAVVNELERIDREARKS